MNKSENQIKRKRIISYLFRYTFLFAVAAAGIFIWFILEQKSFCWETDTSSQYIPKAVYFIRYIKDALHRMSMGDFTVKMYDFSIGFGDKVPFHTEPVYWLYLLFKETWIEYAYGILILLRFYLAGLSISAFFLYFNISAWESLIGSLVYVFSGYSLFVGMCHSHFIVTLIMLPLLLLGIEEIYRGRRWYLCTVFVAFSFWCGYYFTYMNTIFMGCYFLLRFFCGEQKRSAADFFKKSGIISGAYILGIGISNITFFNTFAGYLTSSRTSSSAKEAESLLTYPSGWMKNLYLSFLSTEISLDEWLWLGFMVLAYFCVLLLFLRKGNRQLKIAFVFGLLFCSFPVFGYIFNGFSTVSNRWSYICAFLIAFITAKMIGELTNLSRKELAAMLLFALPYLYLGIGNFIRRKEYIRSVRDAGVMLLLTWAVLVLFHCQKHMSVRIKRRILTCNAIILLWCLGAFRYASYYGGMLDEFTDMHKVYKKAIGTPLKVLENTDDGEEFFRSYSKNSDGDVQGAAMMLDYDGVVYYSSTVGRPVIDFYRDLGLTSWSLVRIRGFDGRGFLNALGSVKYEGMRKEYPYDVPYGYSLKDEIAIDAREYLLYETDYYLPLGSAYDQTISLEEFHKIPTVMRQEVMLQAAVTDEDLLLDSVKTVDAEDIGADENGIRISSEKIPITDYKCENGMEFDGTTIKVTQKDAKLTLYFDGLENCETYLSLEKLRMNTTDKRWIYINSDSESYKVNYYYHGDNQTYTTRQEDYIFNLGYSEEGKTFCSIRFISPCTLTVDEIAIYCQHMDELGSYVEERRQDAMINETIGINTVSGTVVASKDEFLVLGIPYSTGWTAYVDGKQTRLYRGNIMYMGLPLERGSHTIVLKYEIPGIRISLVLTLLFLAVFLLLLCRDHRRKSRARRLP